MLQANLIYECACATTKSVCQRGGGYLCERRGKETRKYGTVCPIHRAKVFSMGPKSTLDTVERFHKEGGIQ